MIARARCCPRSALVLLVCLCALTAAASLAAASPAAASPATALPATAPAATALSAITAGQSGSLAGQVTALSPAGDGSPVPVAGVSVTATSLTGVVYSTSTTSGGYYELDRLPAPAIYSLSFVLTVGQPADESTVTVAAGTVTTAGATLTQPVATIVGRVTGRRGHALAGMPVGLVPTSPAPCSSGAICGPATTTGAGGGFALNVAPGSYELAIADAGHLTDEQSVDAVAGQSITTPIRLPAPAIPAGTVVRHAVRDLSWLNAERVRDGLPAGIVLNPRWSTECAAHDAYERANGVLTHTENPQAPGASSGGAWAGLTSVLAQSRWTSAANPWENAPIHLMQLLTPSLSVIGLDDGGGLQCATTYPGLVRAAVTSDSVFTYPADGARGIPPRETAREAPFVPGQFVGIAAGRTAGRELFVYLDQAGQAGPAQVKLVQASLARDHHAVAVRWVDNSTPTVGQYLTGAIVIPVAPLHAHTTYTVAVVIQDRSTTISHSWSFTTGAG